MINLVFNLLLRRFGDGFVDPKLKLGVRLRHLFIQKALGFNRHVPWPVHWTSCFKAISKIDRGTRFPGLSRDCYFDARNGIVIGENVWIGPRVSLISMNHRVDDYTKYEMSTPIVIGDNCWLGANVTILAGVRIGNHTVCAAGAVVAKSFEDTDIVLAGVPAQIIKRIPPYVTTERKQGSKDETHSKKHRTA